MNHHHCLDALTLHDLRDLNGLHNFHDLPPFGLLRSCIDPLHERSRALLGNFTVLPSDRLAHFSPSQLCQKSEETPGPATFLQEKFYRAGIGTLL